MFDRGLLKICPPTKENAEKSLESLGVYPEKIIKVSGFFMWEILFHSPEEWRW